MYVFLFLHFCCCCGCCCYFVFQAFTNLNECAHFMLNIDAFFLNKTLKLMTFCFISFSVFPIELISSCCSHDYLNLWCHAFSSPLFIWIILIYFTISVSFSRRTICEPISFTSGHCLITNIAIKTKKTVVKTRNLQWNQIIISNVSNAFRLNSNKLIWFTYLVFKNGIIIPAAVATSNKTTCNTVNTTFISLTISARAFELSIPSTVTYCCCDKCSIFEIYGANDKWLEINADAKGKDAKLMLIALTLVWQFSKTSFTSRNLSSLWYCTFSSISANACFRFSISFYAEEKIMSIYSIFIWRQNNMLSSMWINSTLFHNIHCFGTLKS